MRMINWQFHFCAHLSKYHFDEYQYLKLQIKYYFFLLVENSNSFFFFCLILFLIYSFFLLISGVLMSFHAFSWRCYCYILIFILYHDFYPCIVVLDIDLRIGLAGGNPLGKSKNFNFIMNINYIKLNFQKRNSLWFEISEPTNCWEI